MTNQRKIAIFADGADLNEMLAIYRKGLVRGFTTNPTLMAKAGIKDYEKFARSVLEVITDLPVSFEVFSDDFDDMHRQARKISAWGRNVNVKIPITNTQKQSSLPLIRKLFDEGMALNITAICTKEQVQALHQILKPADDAIISIFAGRIADTGVDPAPMMSWAVNLVKDKPGAKILWASPREVLNMYQAEACGVHIITMTEQLIAKLPLGGKPLDEYSLDTVKMFYDDARKSGFSL